MLAAKACLALTGVTATVITLIFLSIPDVLIKAFLDVNSEEALLVLAIGIQLVYLAAAFQLSDALQIVALGLLRGLSDTRTPMLIAVFSYAVVGLPTSYYLGFKADMGGVGIWVGFVAGLGVAATLLLFRFRWKLKRVNFVDNDEAVKADEIAI